MGNRFGMFLGLIGLIVLTVWSAFFVVNEREQAIVLRFGEIVRVEIRARPQLQNAVWLCRTGYGFDYRGPASAL